MYIEKLQKRLAEKQAEKDKLVKRSQESNDVDEVKKIEEGLSALQEDINAIQSDIDDFKEKKQASEKENDDEERSEESADEENSEEDNDENADENKKKEDTEQRSATVSNQKTPELRRVACYGKGANKENNMDKEIRNQTAEAEKRAAEFAQTKTIGYDAAETRALLISGGNIATPTKVSGINDTFNEVSSIVDLVTVEDCSGMGTDRVAYKVSSGKAASKKEGQSAGGTGMVTKYTDITPETLAVYDEISRETIKQTPLKYRAKVDESARIGLRIAAAEKIIKSVAASKVIEATGRMTIDAIGPQTLRNIVLNYGGSLNVAGEAYLFLTKEDLVAFGDVRGTNEKKAVYEIIPDVNNTNIGIIKDGGLVAKYCLNDTLVALAKATLTEGEMPTMMYGNPKTIKLDLFSNYEVRASEDHKFRDGVIAIMGDTMVGCDVVQYNGMMVITKKSA